MGIARATSDRKAGKGARMAGNRNESRTRSRALPSRIPGLGLAWGLMLTLGLTFGLGAPACGRAQASTPPRGAERAQTEDTDRTFARIASAWQAGDERALANLVHPDGLRVTGEDSPARALTYSPSQAFYYFKNLFQGMSTLSFEFQRRQDPSAGERVHGLAAWQFRRGGREDADVQKLVFVLIRSQDRWLLSEITVIR